MVAALATVVSTSAFADVSTASIEEIGAAIGGDLDPLLNAAQIAEVQKQRKEADELNAAGLHEEAVALPGECAG